jgi:hypothetical protein
MVEKVLVLLPSLVGSPMWLSIESKESLGMKFILLISIRDWNAKRA